MTDKAIPPMASGDIIYCLREQLKGGSRMNKAELISTLNPDWFDLTSEGEQII